MSQHTPLSWAVTTLPQDPHLLSTVFLGFLGGILEAELLIEQCSDTNSSKRNGQQDGGRTATGRGDGDPNRRQGGSEAPRDRAGENRRAPGRSGTETRQEHSGETRPKWRTTRTRQQQTAKTRQNTRAQRQFISRQLHNDKIKLFTLITPIVND